MSKRNFCPDPSFSGPKSQFKCHGRVQRWLGRWKLLPKIMLCLLQATAECLFPLGRWMCLSRKYTACAKRDLADLNGWAPHISDKWTLGMLGRWILTLGWVTPMPIHFIYKEKWREMSHLGSFPLFLPKEKRKKKRESCALPLTPWAKGKGKIKLIFMFSSLYRS